MRRERNKLAAARCRKRRVDQTETLQDEVNLWEGKKKALQEQIQQLQEEKNQLAFILEAHKSVCSRASSAGESRTRAPSEHGAPPHPRRGDGGEPAPAGDGDDNSKIGSSRRSPETKTPLKPPCWERVEQLEQPQCPDRDPDQRDEPARLQRPDGRQDGADPHEHSHPDHGEHDHPFQLGSAPDPNSVNTNLWKPAKVWSERRDAGARSPSA